MSKSIQYLKRIRKHSRRSVRGQRWWPPACRRMSFEHLENRVVLSANVALGADVSLEGAPFFTDGWGGGMIVDPQTVVDGVFLPQSTQWDQGAVWWDGHDGETRSVVIELGAIYEIESLIVQADDNDAYDLYYRDVKDASWVKAWDVPNYDVFDGIDLSGMQTRPNPTDDTERYVLPVPIITSALKLEGDAADSDLFFSTSEIQAFGGSSVDIDIKPGSDPNSRAYA